MVQVIILLTLCVKGHNIMLVKLSRQFSHKTFFCSTTCGLISKCYYKTHNIPTGIMCLTSSYGSQEKLIKKICVTEG